MLLAILLGLVIVLVIAALIYYSPEFSKFVGMVNTAGLFVLIVLFGFMMIGDRVIGWLSK